MLDFGFYNMDCLEGMRQFPDNYFELAIVDPPYRDIEDNQPTKAMRSAGTMKRFGNRPGKEYFDELFRVSKNAVIWGSNNFSVPPYKGFIVWDKVIPFDFTMSMAEIASITEGLGTISKIVRIRASGGGLGPHPSNPETRRPLQVDINQLREPRRQDTRYSRRQRVVVNSLLRPRLRLRRIRDRRRILSTGE